MSFLDILLHALSNLRRQKLRTFLTVSGVALGVATIVIMVSFGAGVRKLVAEKFDRAELLTQIQVQPVKIPSLGSLDDLRKLSQQKPQQKTINDETIETLKKIPNVVAVYPGINAMLTVEHDGHVETISTEGLPLAAIGQNHKGSLVGGRYWESEEEEAVGVLPTSQLAGLGFKNAQEALGKKLVLMRFDELFRYDYERIKDEQGNEKQGRAIRRKDAKTRTLTVIGVYDSDQFGISGGRIHVPTQVGKDLFAFSGIAKMFGQRVKEGEYPSLVVKVADRRDAAGVRERIEALDYGTVMTTDFLKWINVFFAVVEAGLALFGGIGLVVACFGIANTMLMAVLERTREIGVLKALGGRDKDVRRIFLLEAASIGIGGGLLGVGAGRLAGLILNAIATSFISDQAGGATVEIFYIPWWLAAGSIGFATFVAAVSGLYPAWRAAKLDPVEALRRE